MTRKRKGKSSKLKGNKEKVTGGVEGYIFVDRYLSNQCFQVTEGSINSLSLILINPLIKSFTKRHFKLMSSLNCILVLLREMIAR